MHTPDKETFVKGTGNFRHILKTGLPPGVEREDVTDPGAKALKAARLRQGAGDGSPLDEFDDTGNKDRV